MAHKPHSTPTIDLASYRLPDNSAEPRCTIDAAAALEKKLSALTSSVPSLEPANTVAQPMGGNPQIGMVLLADLIAAGAAGDDDRYALITHLKADEIPMADRADGGDPIFVAYRHHWPTAMLVLAFQSGDAGQLRDMFMNLAGTPGTGGGGDPQAGLVPFLQFMNQGAIKDEVKKVMQSGLPTPDAAPAGEDFSKPNPMAGKGKKKNTEE